MKQPPINPSKHLQNCNYYTLKGEPRIATQPMPYWTMCPSVSRELIPAYLQAGCKQMPFPQTRHTQPTLQPNPQLTGRLDGCKREPVGRNTLKPGVSLWRRQLRTSTHPPISGLMRVSAPPWCRLAPSGSRLIQKLAQHNRPVAHEQNDCSGQRILATAPMFSDSRLLCCLFSEPTALRDCLVGRGRSPLDTRSCPVGFPGNPGLDENNWGRAVAYHALLGVLQILSLPTGSSQSRLPP